MSPEQPLRMNRIDKGRKRRFFCDTSGIEMIPPGAGVLRYWRNRSCNSEGMSNFWTGTITVVVTTLAIFSLYWYMMFKPTRKRQSKPDHRT
jgi:hypothetical protein